MQKTFDEGPAVPVAIVTSRAEAELIAGMLRDNDLSAVVSADDAGGQDPALQVQGVRVLTFASDAPAAIRLLAAAQGSASVPKGAHRQRVLTEYESQYAGSSPANTSRNWLRPVMPSLGKMLYMCDWMVRGERYSRWPIARLVCPAAAIWAICSS